MTREPASPSAIRDLVRDAERLRRGRLVDRQIVLIAPFVGAALVGFAVIARLLSFRSAIAIGVIALAVIATGVYAWLGRRTPDISDAIAAQLDRDAASAGELRSAYWFAGQAQIDEWASYHLTEASGRLEAIS